MYVLSSRYDIPFIREFLSKGQSIGFILAVNRARDDEKAALQLQAEGDHSMAAEFTKESIDEWCYACGIRFEIAYYDYLKKKHSYR
jgi:hypothetical protein